MKEEQLSKRENKLVALLSNKGYDIKTFTKGKTGQEFDVHMEGVYTFPPSKYFKTATVVNAKAYMPLAAIRELVNWCDPKVAYMSSYPEMAIMGDWSGIRDSTDEEIMSIFNTFVLSKLT